jgi:hypothetical protein
MNPGSKRIAKEGDIIPHFGDKIVIGPKKLLPNAEFLEQCVKSSRGPILAGLEAVSRFLQF